MYLNINYINSRFLNKKYPQYLNNQFIPHIQFKADIKEYKFFEIFENLEKFKTAPKKVSELQTENIQTSNLGSKAEFMVDFILTRDPSKPKNVERIQYDLFKNRAYREKKEGKEFVDILHQGISYRFAIAYENKTPIPIEELINIDPKLVNTIRVKSRRSWAFEFMSIDMTTTFLLNRNFKHLKLFMKMFSSLLGQTLSKFINNFFN